MTKTPQLENGFTRIANPILEKIALVNLSPYETRTIMALWRKTWGWGKREDRISITQFQRITGLDRRNQVRALVRLEKRKLVNRRKTKRTTVYSFQKCYERWRLGAVSPLAKGRGGVAPRVGAVSPLATRGDGDTHKRNYKETYKKKGKHVTSPRLLPKGARSSDVKTRQSQKPKLGRERNTAPVRSREDLQERAASRKIMAEKLHGLIAELAARKTAL